MVVAGVAVSTMHTSDETQPMKMREEAGRVAHVDQTDSQMHFCAVFKSEGEGGCT